jgi:hypothetical protein
VAEQSVLCICRVRQRTAVEAFSLVLDSDGDFTIHAATAPNMDPFTYVLMITVDYAIRKSLAQRCLDSKFALFRRAEFICKQLDEAHDCI